VKTYDNAMDSTLPKVSKKRKFSEENGGASDEEVKAKIPKVEEVTPSGNEHDFPVDNYPWFVY